MLYTRKGDNGTTKTFRCDQRISKSSATAEALGALDEVNSFLGLVKVKSAELKFDFENKTFEKIVHEVQENLFIIQAEVAGFDKDFADSKITEIETLVDGIEKKLPPIKTFFISGGTELASLFDISRTMARRAERRVVAVNDEIEKKLRPVTLGYLNRLSSLLYALARYSNFLAKIEEPAPGYK
jgi:cob(I)alamin adenosyltransferase